MNNKKAYPRTKKPNRTHICELCRDLQLTPIYQQTLSAHYKSGMPEVMQAYHMHNHTLWGL